MTIESKYEVSLYIHTFIKHTQQMMEIASKQFNAIPYPFTHKDFTQLQMTG